MSALQAPHNSLNQAASNPIDAHLSLVVRLQVDQSYISDVCSKLSSALALRLSHAASTVIVSDESVSVHVRDSDLSTTTIDQLICRFIRLGGVTSVSAELTCSNRGSVYGASYKG